MFAVTTDHRRNREALRGVHVAVLGAARSGIWLCKLLAAKGARVMLSETRRPHELDLPVSDLEPAGVLLEFGGHSEAVLAADLICISPGIPPDIPILRDAAAAGIPVLGELEVASWFCDAPMVAITGSQGKTTTTTLTAEILKTRFHPLWLCGNIGTPVAQLALETPSPRLAVLEVSSFQLETIAAFHPHIAVLTNLSPNHLDRYENYAAYVDAKMRILQNMSAADYLLYNADDAGLREKIVGTAPQKVPFSISRELSAGAFWAEDAIHVRWEQINTMIPIEKSRLRGPHNRYNMTAAAMIGLLNGVKEREIKQVIETCPGIEHRLEYVATVKGVDYINDSKATTVESLKYALLSFDQPIVLIAGGKDKGGNFAELNDLLAERVVRVVLIGEAKARMRRTWEDVVPLSEATSLQEAVEIARRSAMPGQVVLLAPACSSFDMFKNYEDRGNQFKAIVKSFPMWYGSDIFS